MKKSSFVLFFVLAAAAVSFGQAEPKVNRDPRAVKFVTTDIDNFWRAYDLASAENDKARKAAIYQSEYIDKGSDGLKDFVRLRIKTAQSLADAIDRLPKYYASIRPATLRVASMQKKVRKSFIRYKKIYPNAVFPDVYFLIGITSSGGTTGPSGLLIGTELYGLGPATPQEELPAWLKSVLSPIDNLPAIVAHESCHYNQQYPEPKTLLGKAIQEGSCDFVGELVSGGNINAKQKIYGDAHEAELWREFAAAMDGTDYKNWLYNGVNSKDRPGDLGYYIGYKIADAYYKRTKDKKQAVRDILEIKDYHEFLKASGYDPASPDPKAKAAGVNEY